MKRFLLGFISCFVALIALFVKLLEKKPVRESITIGLDAFSRYLIFGDEPRYYSHQMTFEEWRRRRKNSHYRSYSSFNNDDEEETVNE